MARININDSLLSDPRFLKLAQEMGGTYQAIGIFYCAARVAMRHWAKGELIPSGEWNELGFGVLVNCRLAEIKGDGIYLSGSEKEFDWYRRKCEQAKKAREGNPKETDETSSVRSSANIASGLELQPTYNPPPAPAPAPAPVISPSEKKINAVSSPPKSKRAKREVVESPVSALVEIWNRHCSHLHKCAALNDERITMGSARLVEFPDLTAWEDCAKAIAKSPWHNGDNPRKWKADFTYFLRPATMVNFLEDKIKEREREVPSEFADLYEEFGK